MKKVVLIFVSLFALTSSYANNFNDLKSSDIENTLIDNVVLNEFDFKSSVDLTVINTSKTEKIEVVVSDGHWERDCVYIDGVKVKCSKCGYT